MVVDTKFRHILRLVLGIAAGALLIVLAFRKVDWQAFLDGLKQCRWTWVGVSMAAGLTALLFRGFRWHRLLSPIDGGLSRRRVFGAYCIGNLCNCVLPASGELVRSAVVPRHREDTQEVLGTAASERVIDLLTLGGTLRLLMAAGWNFIGSFVRENIVQPIAANPRSILLLSILAVAVVTVLILIFARRLPFPAKARGFLVGVWKGIKSIRAMEGKGWFLLDTVVIWSLYWIQVLAISKALGLSLLPKDALLLSALGSIASVIPVPGGIGAYHYILALALSSLYGMNWNEGILFATLCHESQLLVSVAAGALSWLIFPVDNRLTDR